MTKAYANAKTICYTTRADLNGAIDSLRLSEINSSFPDSQFFYLGAAIKEISYCLEKLKNVSQEIQNETRNTNADRRHEEDTKDRNIQPDIGQDKRQLADKPKRKSKNEKHSKSV